MKAKSLKKLLVNKEMFLAALWVGWTESVQPRTLFLCVTTSSGKVVATSFLYLTSIDNSNLACG